MILPASQFFSGSPASDFVTGAAVSVDGGFSTRLARPRYHLLGGWFCWRLFAVHGLSPRISTFSIDRARGARVDFVGTRGERHGW
jgi:hypothetical protein